MRNLALFSSRRVEPTGASCRESNVVNTPLFRTNSAGRAPAARPHLLSRIRYQLLLGLFLAVIFPTAIYHASDLTRAIRLPSSLNTLVGGAAAFTIALYLYRRVASFPGVGLLSYVMPAVAGGYGLILAVLFAGRFDYSRLNFAMSFATALAFLFFVSTYLRNFSRRCYFVIPSDHALGLVNLREADWIVLQEPRLPDDRRAVLIADLRADMDEPWERLIAEASLNGYPVYHSKQVQESLTGRVEIEHLSENSFGSLIPNHSYRRVKRLVDVILCVAVLPILVPAGLIVGGLIRLDSRGPIFFRQTRRGYRGRDFQVLKFRTMFVRADEITAEAVANAITQSADPRITRVGQFLRRTRIDELPQVWNILRGEMSWIGPRPEALPLSQWYMKELPFYTYRHIVRPGITGWAQVNQGHVADLPGVLEKLNYDFFYIKYFSAWLDFLIFMRTIGVVFSGFGAK